MVAKLLRLSIYTSHVIACYISEQQRHRSASRPRILSGEIVARSIESIKALVSIDRVSRDGDRKINSHFYFSLCLQYIHLKYLNNFQLKFDMFNRKCN